MCVMKASFMDGIPRLSGNVYMTTLVFVKQHFGMFTRLKKCEVNEGAMSNDYWIHVEYLQHRQFVLWNYMYVTSGSIQTVVFIFGCLQEENIRFRGLGF